MVSRASTLVVSGALGALSVGCGASSEIAPYGKDSYIISIQDSMGSNSSARLQVTAAKEASAYCAQQGKVMRMRNTSGSGAQWFTGTSSNMIFSCIGENDPENTRPNVKREPNAVVEVRTEGRESGEDGVAHGLAGPDETLCVNAFAHIQELTDAWIKGHGGTARDDLASRERFADVCGHLPESMQLCLNLQYLNAHVDQCDVAYTKLPESQQQLLARLFVRK